MELNFQSREYLETVRNIQRNASMYNDFAIKANAVLADTAMRFQEIDTTVNSNMVRLLQAQQKFSVEITDNKLRFASSFADLAVKIRNSIPFEQLAAIDFSYLDEMDDNDVELSDEMKAHIQQEIQVQLNAMNENEAPITATYQEFFVKLSNSIPVKVLFPILLLILPPLTNMISEEIQETIT